MSGIDLASREEAELLAETGTLRRRARSTRHAYWFPLVLFGLITVAATPFYCLPGAERLAHLGLSGLAAAERSWGLLGITILFLGIGAYEVQRRQEAVRP